MHDPNIVLHIVEKKHLTVSFVTLLRNNMANLVNNFEKAIEEKKIKQTRKEINEKLQNESFQTHFCNKLIKKILKCLKTKRGLDGNVCTFSLRTYLFEKLFTYDEVGKSYLSLDLKMCNMLNDCLKVHQELKSFKAVTIDTKFNECLPTDLCGSESEAVIAFCFCCPCWFPLYCIPMNLIDIAFGKEIVYEITLSLVEPKCHDIVAYGIPYEKTVVKSLVSASGIKNSSAIPN